VRLFRFQIAYSSLFRTTARTVAPPRQRRNPDEIRFAVSGRLEIAPRCESSGKRTTLYHAAGAFNREGLQLCWQSKSGLNRVARPSNAYDPFDRLVAQ
jgi:hypothetical protein